jgi:hypothetical protein
MSITNEEHLEEILYEAHRLGLAKQLNEMAASLILKGTSRHRAYELAHYEIVIKRNEIYRKGYTGPGKTGEND